jgi:hypothetical protein
LLGHLDNPNQLEIAQEFRLQAQRIFGLFRAERIASAAEIVLVMFRAACDC